MDINFTPSLVRDFQRIYSISEQLCVEYAGSTRWDGFKFSQPTSCTDGLQHRVSPSFSDLNQYIVYHTHPIPTDLVGNFFTLPSADDWKVYLDYCPYLQVNVICERLGYLIVDTTGIDLWNKPTPENILNLMGYFACEHDLNHSVHYRENVSFDYITDVTIDEWKDTIRKLSHLLQFHYNIKIDWYTYSETAPVSLRDKDSFMIP